MPDSLDDLIIPYRERALSLADWLRSIAAQMDAGTWSDSSEALLIVRATDTTSDYEPITTLLYWGEDCGLTSQSTLDSIAALHRNRRQ